ncbi:hypothetical protein A9Q84_16400 [Halobacteriovorax marinus]|uniref:Uncharacterized protein n=1 Tax=Halobacteriovorax marinus TaxID=97084 RepID=A0A1Y5F4M2_9BACT|nr:hypothetical protein A9Q84_16400 [Halobacteriovorax marinus]
MRITALSIYLSILVSLQSVCAGPIESIQGYWKSFDYELEASESYDFKSCQKYNDENETEYYLKCIDNNLVQENQMEHLLKDINAVEKKIISEQFLASFQENILEELKNNQSKLKEVRQCLATNEMSKNCEKIKHGLLLSVREDLPQLRMLMAQMNMPGHVYSSQKEVERFQRSNLEHPVNEKLIANVTPKEAQRLKEHTEVLDTAFTQDILKLNLLSDSEAARVDEDYSQIKDIRKCIDASVPTDLKLFKTNKCRMFEGIVAYRVNNKFDRQNKVYKSAYNQLLATNPMLSILSITGEETDAVVLSEVKTVLNTLDKEGEKAIARIKGLEGDEREELLGFNVAVENFLKRQGPSQIMCDVTQELKDDLDMDTLKTDLYIGAGALIGGGVCAFTWGVGCIVGVAVGAEALAIGVSQDRYERAQNSFFTGLTDSKTTEDKEFDRNLSLYLAPLALVGGAGKAVLQGAYKRTQKTFTKRRVSNKPVVNNQRVGDRRVDSAQRDLLITLEKRLKNEGSFRNLMSKYNPINIVSKLRKYDLSSADEKYLLGIAEMIEKQNKHLSPAAMKSLVVKELDDLVKQCKAKGK